MNPKTCNKFYRKFPTIFKDKVCIDIDDGWEKILWNLCKKLEYLAVQETSQLTKKQIKSGVSYHIVQIKEKFAELRVYMHWATDDMYSVIREAEGKSIRVCEQCGRAGRPYRSLPWQRTLCKWHFFKQLSSYTLRGKLRILWRELCGKY